MKIIRYLIIFYYYTYENFIINFNFDSFFL